MFQRSSTAATSYLLPDSAISNIYIEPNSRLAAVNISSEEAGQLMKAKYPGTHYVYDATTNITTATELYRFDFTDYMRKLELSLPAAAKSLNIKLTFESIRKMLISQVYTAEAVELKISIRIVQDKAIESRGYRRYFTQDVSVTAKGGKEQIIHLPRTGLLDSLYIKPDGDPLVGLEDIIVEKDDEKFPLKSFQNLEEMVAQLHNDEAFDANWIYCDLPRPILAERARTLKLKLGIPTSYGGNGTVRIMYEYVHFGE
jgi:hypothetical protein